MQTGNVCSQPQDSWLIQIRNIYHVMATNPYGSPESGSESAQNGAPEDYESTVVYAIYGQSMDDLWIIYG